MARKKIFVGPNGRKLRRPTKAEARAAALAKERLQAVQLDQAYPELLPDADEYVNRIESLTALANEIENGSELVEKGAAAVKKLSRVQHMTTIMGAYAYWIKSGTQRPYQLFVQKAAARRKAKPNSKFNPKTTSLHLIVESLISYGESDGDTRSHSRLYSRDVQAIRWLNHKRLSPTQALELSEEPGEGLKKWAARWAKHEKEEAAANASSETSGGLPEGQPNGPEPTSADTNDDAIANLPAADPGDVPSQPTAFAKSDPIGATTDDTVEVVWTFGRSGASQKLTLALTDRSTPKITNCLEALKEIDLNFRRNPFGG